MIKRLATRFACSIDVLACTPILTVDARIVDLSRLGAQLSLERPFARGMRIHLDVEGHYYWATVMWEEVDRIGLRFRSPVSDGPLETALKGFVAPRTMVRPSSTAPAARLAGGFGRRVGLHTA